MMMSSEQQQEVFHAGANRFGELLDFEDNNDNIDAIVKKAKEKQRRELKNKNKQTAAAVKKSVASDAANGVGKATRSSDKPALNDAKKTRNSEKTVAFSSNTGNKEQQQKKNRSSNNTRGENDNRRSKRTHDRHSGSDKTGVKPVEKRGGGGAHNWGKLGDYGEEDIEGKMQNMSIANGVKKEATGGASGGEESAGEKKVEAPKQMTMAEWKAQKMGFVLTEHPGKVVDEKGEKLIDLGFGNKRERGGRKPRGGAGRGGGGAGRGGGGAGGNAKRDGESKRVVKKPVVVTPKLDDDTEFPSLG